MDGEGPLRFLGTIVEPIREPPPLASVRTSFHKGRHFSPVTPFASLPLRRSRSGCVPDEVDEEADDRDDEDRDDPEDLAGNADVVLAEASYPTTSHTT